MRLLRLIMTLACAAGSASAAEHPRLLFSQSEIPGIRARAQDPALKPYADRLLQRAQALLQAPPLRVSLSKRGEPDAAGEIKGLEAARRLQGRVLTFCMAFTLSGQARYRDAAVAELDKALDWPSWVDTAHQPPFDLMAGENSMTFGLAYDWLYRDLTEDQRRRLREGAARRALQPYLEAAAKPKPPFWLTATHNWNPVCNGGAVVLALALSGESGLSDRVLARSVPALRRFWDRLGPDGGWEEGVGYWVFGMRYGFLAAEALRRSGREEGAAVFAQPGARSTAYFPMAFCPGRSLAAGFSDSNGRADDPLFYLLGREYRNPDFIWFQDRNGLAPVKKEGWPQEALALLWRRVSESWLPEARAAFVPSLPQTAVFPSIGWALMADRQPDPRFFLAFKNGSLDANHTHLDLDHLSLGVGDQMVLAELGSRPYPADYFDRKKRYGYYELSTAGHNSVLIGGQGQVPGREGKLEGPFQGPGYEELVGRADDAYAVPAARVRRHVVFVRRRYWVILDEAATPVPRSMELRFHSYGSVSRRSAGNWLFEQGDAALELFTAGPQPVSDSLEQPKGWIRPVQAVSLKTAAARETVLATVLYPRGRTEPAMPRWSVETQPALIEVSVGEDRLDFDRSDDGGWKVKSLRP
ncbi:MAG: heparinase II/III family protein [Elusimicrobia bacterium]|nr:heparinase II/III family protein [Elusimicrobiota bacterium]